MDGSLHSVDGFQRMDEEMKYLASLWQIELTAESRSGILKLSKKDNF